MSLSTSVAYPLVSAASKGWAVVSVMPPYTSSREMKNDEVVHAAREHAQEWERFADRLRGLLDAGWALQGEVGLHATRASGVAELPAHLGGLFPRGTAVEWCVADTEGGLFAVGGLAVGSPAPPETFPGSVFPALVVNGLTGAQQQVENEVELRLIVANELEASAAWWRAHPDVLSDQAAHDVVQQLDDLSDAVLYEPVPALVSQAPGLRGLLEKAPRTHIAVHPVSAIIFTGLMEATNQFSSLAHAPREGLGQAFQARGRELAVELGLVSMT
jgi:hypothetical protein